MTDFALPGVRTLDLTSDAARARVRARYRAEARFKFYGLAAIGLTALFLLVVLTDIVVKGLSGLFAAPTGARRDGRPRRDRPAGNARSRPSSAPAISRRWCATRCARNFPMSAIGAGRRLLDGILSSGASDMPARAGRRRPALWSARRSRCRCCCRTMPTSTTRASARASSGAPAAESLTPSGTTGDVVLLSSVQRLRARHHRP